MKRFPMFGLLVSMSVSIASAQQVTAEKAEVLKPGSGSFASYLTQSAGAQGSGGSLQGVTPTQTPPSSPAFVLKKGELVHTALQAWATAAGWELIWYPDKSWKVLGDTTIAAGDVAQAVSEVVTILRDERRPVRLEIADGNRIMEVLSTDVVSNQEAFRE